MALFMRRHDRHEIRPTISLVGPSMADSEGLAASRVRQLRETIEAWLSLKRDRPVSEILRRLRSEQWFKGSERHALILQSARSKDLGFHRGSAASSTGS